MKILIVTFTSGNNPGTFMQGLGVQTAIQKIYPQAKIDFLKFPDFKPSSIGVRDKNAKLWQTFRQKAASAYRLLKYNKLRKQMLSFTPSIDLFHYTKEAELFIKQFELVVIGSDTILEEAYGDNCKIGLNWMPFEVKKIYFAASASPANFKPNEDLKKIAANAQFIGLRDNLTIDFFIDKLGVNKKRIIKQPDPSFFLDIKNFKLSNRQKRKLKDGKKYALYNFNSNFPLRKELADAIRKVGYVVVSTAYNPYADICFDTIDAFEWAGVFPLMDVIVTERFHDSVFGLRNCKPVIAVDWDPNRFAKGGESKTLCILEDYGMEKMHFNLCGKNNLSPIIKCLENVDLVFNKDFVKEINNRICKNCYTIMDMIKSKIEV